MRSLIAAFVLMAMPSPAIAQTAQPPETWTAVISEGVFSGYVYTWRVKRDGTYDEDGRDARTGEPIQTTLQGTWTRTGNRMRLTQEFGSYVFDGLRSGDRYSGRFMSGPDTLAAFCAWKGTRVPTGCDDELVG